MKLSYVMLGCILSAFALMTIAHGDDVPAKIGKFPQEVSVKYSAAQGLPSNSVLEIASHGDGPVMVRTEAGGALLKNGVWTPASVDKAVFLDKGEIEGGQIHQFAFGKDGTVYAAAASGLFQSKGSKGDVGVPDGPYERIAVSDGLGRLWAASDVLGVAVDTSGDLWFASRAGVGRRSGGEWTFYTGNEGLPYNDFTCAAAGPNGEVWFGTHKGAIRFDSDGWAYRQGLRWLPDDDIRGIAVDSRGNAWFATANGVGCIERRMMTLAEKADFYEEEMERYIRRTPWGYVSEVGLGAPGDRSQIIYSDSDNDGLWTSMYGAGECFAYAATGDPKAKDRAKRAFEALRFLQKAPEGSEQAPPKGYVARTILSADSPDPNIGRVESDKKTLATSDKLWKVYEPRWPLTADRKWYWKSDTSSDELDGHYFFYPAYYDLVADTEEEKERVREVVRDLTDHLIDHDFDLVDHDGTPTRWSRYSPEELNHSKWWWSERGLKSLSMLSYLAVAEHITGDSKYGDVSRMLEEEHAYGTNAMVPKIHLGPGAGNHSDDEMAIMCFYNFVKYTQNEALREEVLFSFYRQYVLEEPELNPFFNFAYAAFGLGATYTNPWGTHPIHPWAGWLEDSMNTLKGFPLDRVDWAQTNSHRIDIVPLARHKAVEPTEPMRSGRGFLVSGKVLPVENRHFNHWNTDPWGLDYGGGGGQLASGTVYLLPYYMGLYHGFIEETE